uniref:Putative iron permease FTR1 family protein n=1 Tax=uncultured marine microorganism HF4000_141I21 TaxID=455526 RepID=B3T2K8_9ZZZZ|nr:putative iron permease FTR1 family protein [uncultured marine microorganism HF4000_141I21]
MESSLTSFASSFFILLREGSEAMLIAILVFLYLDKVKARNKRPAVFWGIAAGIVASMFVALGFKKIAGITHAHEELFEGGVMLVAACMLTYVAFFCHHAKQHVEGQVDKAVATGNSFILSFTVFLAILREGFEIVLFYAALIGSGMYNTIPVFVGAAAGTLALIGVYFGLNKITKIIPIGVFFRASSILLFVLAIYFAYEGIHELQEGFEELASVTVNILIS